MKCELKYRIENGSLIIDNYFNNLKIGSINGGSVENILNKCKLYDEEYETLLKENEYMTHIAKDFEQLQQENKRLKMIIKEYERLDNGESRGCTITRVDEYDIYDLIKCKDNWNKLKEWVNKRYDYYMNREDYIGGRLCFTDMKNKMQELEQGSDSNVKD